MGVLTDFVVADRADAQRVCDSSCPSRDFDGLDAKGIDTVNLGTLHAILTGGEFDPSFMSGPPCCLRGEDVPLVCEVPQDLVLRLARLTAVQLQSAGEKWAATEEFSPQYGNWPGEAVQQVLRELAALCKRADEEGKAVLMWMCL
jgi:hypothetical protein